MCVKRRKNYKNEKWRHYTIVLIIEGCLDIHETITSWSLGKVKSAKTKYVQWNYFYGMYLDFKNILYLLHLHTQHMVVVAIATHQGARKRPYYEWTPLTDKGTSQRVPVLSRSRASTAAVGTYQA